MLRARIIPCLLVHDKGLVKTVAFASPKYVGDPLNAVRIFNEKEVDELVVLDIDATARGVEPDYVMIRQLAAECRMPLCYGGGVRTVEQAQRILQLGVEKVALSQSLHEDPTLVTRMAASIGGQSVVAVLDVRKHSKSGMYECFTVNGYDLELVERVRDATTVPLSVLGGAGTLKDLEGLVERHRIIGACAGSLFVFKGIYRAVLINYPNREQKAALCATGAKR